MAYRKKDLFTIKNIKPEDRIFIANADRFPPSDVKWNGDVLTLLGESNKDDLLKESNFPGDTEVIKAFEQKLIGQFLYTDDAAELFEVVLIQNETSEIYIAAIRTRRKA